MSGDTSRRARLRRLLRWLVHGDLSFAWIRPRRSLLPAVLAVALALLALLHEPSGGSGGCAGTGPCFEVLRRMAESEPGVLAGAVGLHVAAAALAYLVGSGVTTLVGRRVDLESVGPRLFAPDDPTLRAVAVLAVAALLTYVAGAYSLAYTVIGVATLYVLYFPMLLSATAFEAAGPPTGPLGEAAAVVLLVALPLLEVVWLYALAHLVASPFDSEDDPDGAVHR